MIYFYHFLTSPFESNFPCRCITLRARKALRVMSLHKITFGRGSAPFQVLSPRQGRKFSANRLERALFRKFRPHEKNPSLKRDFYITHKLTQRIHSWIGRDLSYPGKLLRSQTNLQILRNLHFCARKTHFFDSPIDARLDARGKPPTVVYRAG